ncbi:hypothetical protein GOV07_01150 [Candidatus Woesearchaeota archaeon]|nr:hypothetical protein [Candidatus Woesearchaeota archaeon]
MKRLLVLVLILVVTVVLSGCMDMFIDSPEMRAALKSGDPEQCKMLIVEKENGDQYHSEQWKCLRRMAEAKGDVNLCDMIEEKNTQEYCIWDVAGATGNELICSHAIDKDRCYSESAHFDNDLEACGLIASDSDEELCIMSISAELGDIEPCFELSEEGAKKCVEKFATKNGAEHCNFNRFDEEERDTCIWLAAETVKDCELMKETSSSWDSCMLKAAVNDESATDCVRIEDWNYAVKCVNQVAINSEDPNACERLMMGNKDTCFKEYAISEKDIKVCDRIEYEKEQKECREAVNG